MWRECKKRRSLINNKKNVLLNFFFLLFFSSSTDSCNMKWLPSSQNCLDGEVLFLISKCWEKEKKKSLHSSNLAVQNILSKNVLFQRHPFEIWRLEVEADVIGFWIKSSKIMIKCCYLRTKCHERTLNLKCLPPRATLLFRNTFLILIHFIKSIFYIIISPTLLLYSLYDILCAFIRFIVITIIAMNIKQLD